MMKLGCALTAALVLLVPAKAAAQSTYPATIDRSSFVAAGGTSQPLAPANPTRRRILIVNPCSLTTQGIAGAETLFVNFGAAASATDGKSIEIATCGSYDSGPGLAMQEAINVTALTTNHKYTAKEW